MSRTKVVVIGNGELCSALLRKLHSDSDTEVLFVIGRTQDSTVVSVDLTVLPTSATELGYTVLSPKDINDTSIVDMIHGSGCDVIVHWGHNQLFSRKLLNASRLGVINVHPGLLPYGRGSGAVYGEVLNDSSTIGWTVHLMSEKFDLGHEIDQLRVHLKGDEYLDEIHELLFQDVVDFYFSAIKKFLSNKKSSSMVGFGRYFPKKAIGDEIIDWNESSDYIFKKVRARSPIIGSVTFSTPAWDKVMVWRVEKSTVAEYIGACGQVIDREKEKGILVKTGDTAIWITEITVGNLDKIIPDFPIGTMFVSNWIMEMATVKDELRNINKRLLGFGT